MDDTYARRYVEWCALSGRISQVYLAQRANVSQISISRVMRGIVVFEQTRYAALNGLNIVRTERGMPALQYEHIIWS